MCHFSNGKPYATKKNKVISEKAKLFHVTINQITTIRNLILNFNERLE